MINLNGSTQYLSTPNALITGYPFTFFAQFNSNSITAAQVLMNVHDATGINTFKIRAAGDVAIDPLRAVTGDGTDEALTTTTGYTAGSWFRAYYSAASSATKEARLNNAGLASGAAARNPTGMVETFIGASVTASLPAQFFSGSISDAAFWNTALSATDRDRLESGISPFFVARDNLVSYLPLIDNALDVISGIVWTEQASPTYTADRVVRIPQNMSMMGAA